MTDLKTLKDLDASHTVNIHLDYDDDDEINWETIERRLLDYKADIRASAIAWLKSSDPLMNVPQDLDGWIKHFFNISEEELDNTLLIKKE